MPLSDELLAHLKQFQSAPFLFVGSGVSRRYIGTEDWSGLLREFAARTPRPYEYFSSKANGDLPQTASEIANIFYEIWWTDDMYAASRAENEGRVLNAESPLKIEVAKHILLHGAAAPADGNLKEEVELLRRATIDGIITTNWDTFLENIFPDLTVYVGQDELLFSHPHSIAEIYKIHGSATNPNSLVLTTADYNRFVERNPYLAAKLLTVFVEHPVIFLGYRLNDENILQILDSIASCLTPENVDKLRDRLLFVQRDHLGEGEGITKSILTTGGKRIPVSIMRVQSFLPVFRALASIRRRLPAKVLRQVKEHVYELVSNSDPRGQLYVMDMDKDVDPSTLEVVYGVGAIGKLAEVGYEGIKRTDLFLEVIHDQDRYDPKIIVRTLLPRFLSNGRVPIFKYLHGAGLLTETGTLNGEVDPRLVKAVEEAEEKLGPYDAYVGKRDEVLACEGGIPEVADKFGVQLAFQYIPTLPFDRIDLGQLQEFLEANVSYLTTTPQIASPYRKLACLYDYLKYGRNM